MKNAYFLNSIFLLILSTNMAFGAGDKIVAGFFPDWEPASKINDVQFDKLTDVLYAFLYPDGTGNLLPTTPGGLTTTLAPLATAAHNAGVRVHVSIGGKNHSYNFSAVAANPTYRQNFVSSLSTIIQTYDLDGVDVDWEFPYLADRDNLTALMQEIRAELDILESSMNKNIDLSMAVAPLVWHNDGISAQSIALSDHIYLMAFDAYGDCCVCDATNHSSMLIAQRALDKWTTGLATTCGGTSTGMNTPNEKIILAIPFYSNSGWYVPYRDFAASNTSAFYNDADGVRNGYGYNSCPIIQQKTELIMDDFGGAGIWTWELTLDIPGPYSLQSCMYEAMQPYLCDAPQPSLGTDVSICGSTSVTLNSNVNTAVGRTFTWKKNGSTVVSNSGIANTYDASTSGTYSVTVNENGCSNTDEIIVEGTLPSIDLGEDVELCSPSFVTLETNMNTNGKTFVWSKNGNTINGESGNSLFVNDAGTYSVTASASGCINQTDEIVVTSGLPSVTSDTICTEGNANLLSNTSVDWFANATGGTALSTGTTYNPYISASSTYYVQSGGGASSENTTLKSDLTGGWAANPNVYGTEFTAMVDVTLKSVDVNAAGGAVTINVVESDGITVVETKVFNSVSGVTTLDLNFDVPAGTYYLNAAGSISELYVDPTEVSDFSISGILTASGTAVNDWVAPHGDEYEISENYGNFANLVVVSGNPCDRVPVYATIDSENESCLITSSNELRQEQSFSVFPNPSIGLFTLNSKENLFFELFDITGKKIEQFSTYNGNAQFGAELEAGVYFVQAIGSNNRLRIVKK